MKQISVKTLGKKCSLRTVFLFGVAYILWTDIEAKVANLWKVLHDVAWATADIQHPHPRLESGIVSNTFLARSLSA